jgi:propionyl-CoA carboxylase beta chain
VLVLSQDFTVFGGSSGRLGGEKMERIARQAMMQGLPLVMLFDGGGHRVQDGQSSRDYAPAMPLFHDLARMSGWVPLVSAILGAGFAANTNYSGMADYVVMVRGQSVMGLAGPALVRAGTGEDITAEALGGAGVQVDQTGLADHGADSEAAALHAIRGFLSYLPSNARQAAPVAADWRAAYAGSDLASIVPANSRRAYDMRRVVAGLADADSVFELKPTFARNAITAFARLAGRPVGFIANQPLVQAGMLDSPACEKIAHFIGLCDAFGLPLIYLVDIPGLSIGSAAERATLGRRSAKLLFELGHATVPRISVILRKGYGLGYLTMAGGRSFDADACFAWPTAEICAMSVEGSVDVAFRRDYESHENPTARRQQLIDDIRAQISPIKAAEGFGVDDVIEPAETRARILEVLDRAPPRRANAMPPKYRAISPI